ncbi:MAG: sugar ABC transporter substrate-binding protein [Spirochaetia bacterium]|nr:sugar ABC transporter substrate-binding protein [Spirochaetia bacterium]
MKKFFVLTVVLVMGFGLFAQGASETSAQPEIAFSLKTITNDAFQKAIADSVESAAKKAGAKFTLVTAGQQTAVSTQVSQIEDLIAKGVDGIVLSPMDSKAVIPVLKKAKAAGIPVVLVDQTIEPNNEDLYITYIGTDNFNAGKVAGQTLAKELGNKGNVLIVRGANGSSAGDQRVDGFKAGIAGTSIKVVGEQPGNWANDKAMQVTENMLQANSDIQGLFTASDVMLNGILTALDNAGKTSVKILSVDGSDDVKAMIKDGEVYGSMAQFPDVMGSKAIELLMGAINGSMDMSSVPKYIDSGTTCITSQTL